MSALQLGSPKTISLVQPLLDLLLDRQRDLQGDGSNRFQQELTHRFIEGPSRYLDRGWAMFPRGNRRLD